MTDETKKIKEGKIEELLEERYAQGQHMMALSIIQTCTMYLHNSSELTIVQLRMERARAIETLRYVCEAFGDNDWEDNLHLSDIIEKHLGDNLFDKEHNES